MSHYVLQDWSMQLILNSLPVFVGYSQILFFNSFGLRLCLPKTLMVVKLSNYFPLCHAQFALFAFLSPTVSCAQLLKSWVMDHMIGTLDREGAHWRELLTPY